MHQFTAAPSKKDTENSGSELAGTIPAGTEQVDIQITVAVIVEQDPYRTWPFS